ncbi:Ig-like domain-containing protein [Thiothrix nivea]|uniref:Outer membrane adhesin like protein n=1 Tax=Thiothrix nivea (strain ATCC 35100 / DSM 5205 / JP2) TaxID=870187 RepID=A0A656HGQ8_THINJ|nr:Ig-like domain-containing protein [Thiothrix nivea]EIJ35583.1 outer membrane adhesin like protein [Thiothrix nivea DSM 5205]
MNNKNNLSRGWVILPLLFCSAAVLAGDGGYGGPFGQIPPSASANNPVGVNPPPVQPPPDTMSQAQDLGQESDGFLDDSSETSSFNTGYVGGNTRLGIGIDTELKGKAEASQVFLESDNSVTIGQGYIGFNPQADKDQGEETLTGAGVKLNHHWVSGDPQTATHVNKVFGAYDQNEQKDKKVTVGYGQEDENLFWSGHVSKGLSGSRDSATPGVREKAYDYGVGGRVGTYLDEQQMRVQGGLDYEWGKDFAANEKRPMQATLSGGVEKFFPDTPHSVGAEVELYKKSGGFVDGDDKAEARGGITYRYDIGSEAGIWQPEQRYRRVRVEIPGQEIKQPPKVERKLVKNTMELESDTFFKVDSAKLTPEAQERMNAVMGQIRASGYEGNIRITGNTCDVGSLQHNQKLSERRANAVRDFMAKNGFKADTLLAQGLGETQPKYPNTDAERHKNRRVDIEYVTYQTQYKDEVIEQGGSSRSDPKVVWRKELIPEPPLWVRQALRNTADHKQTVDTYRTAAGGGGVVGPDAPTANNDAAITTVGTPVTINVLDNDTDPNGDVLTIVSFNQGNNGSVTQQGNSLVYTPVAGFTGQDTFTYVITDPAGNQSTATVTVTVTDTGDNTPVAVNDTATTTSGSPVAINVLANDTDPNGDPLSIVSFNQGNNGSVTQVGNNLVYTPVAGFTGTDSFTYVITDPAGNQSTATVTVTVNPANPNDTPVANNDSAVTTSGTPVSVDVLANDTDPNGDPLTIASFGQGSNGSVTQNGNNLVYTPAVGFSGTDSFTYVITDPAGNQSTATVTVTVNPANPNVTPVANNDSAVTTSGSPVTVDVLANDTDPNGDPLSIAGFGQGNNGSVTQNGNNLVYTPAAGFTGTDSFTYTVTDPDGNQSTATVTVTVNQVGPNVPVANNDAAATTAGEAVTVNVLANDTDPNGDVLVIASFNNGSNGSVTQENGQLVYTPAAGFTGTDSFTYTVTDPDGNQSTATVTVTVRSPDNRAPNASNDNATTTSTSVAGNPVTIDVLGNDTDPDGDALSIASFGQGSSGTVTQNGNNLVYTPAPGFVGTDTFTYTVTDPSGVQATATVTVVVDDFNPGPNQPVAVNDTDVHTGGNQPVTIDVTANDTDPNGDAVTIADFTQPANGTVTQVGDNLVYTPNPGFSGTDTFTYTVQDPDGNQSTAGTVTVTVNDAPITANDSASTTVDTAVTIDVLNNDNDPNGQAISITGFGQGGHGTVTQVGDNLVYTPGTGYTGPDTFTYTVTDSMGMQSTATVDVVVASSLVLVHDYLLIDLNDTAPKTLYVLENDTGDELRIVAITKPAYGTATISADGKSIQYQLRSGYCTDHYFTYTVEDKYGNRATQTVMIDVKPANMDPNTPPA